MKKIVMVLIVFVLIIGCYPAFGEDMVDGYKAATYLYELGLFRGTGVNSEGEPIFDLDRAPTRAEALVMLMRLMGLEDEALSSSHSHPFNDTENWNEPYIGYAYANGLTKGVSDAQFGGEISATAPMYLTFVLRALGYSDSGADIDFNYEEAAAFAMELGLVDEFISLDEGFTRGDVALISKNALSQLLRTGDKTLYEIIVAEGDSLQNAPQWNDDQTMISLPLEPLERKENHQAYGVSYSTVLEFFPKTTKVLYTSSTEEDSFLYQSERYSLEELRFIEALSYEDHYSEASWMDDTVLAVEDCRIYLVDDNYNVIAQSKVPQFVSDQEKLIFTIGSSFDGSNLNEAYHKVIDTVEENWEKNDFQLGEERYKPWDDGSGISYDRPVIMNGRYTSEGWYRSVYSYPPFYDELGTIASAEKVMADVFFFSDSTMEVDGVGFNGILSDTEFSYPRIDEEGAPVTRGIRFGEYDNWDRIIYFFSKDGVYYGQILVPANK